MSLRDENGDGKPERRTTFASIGSGWKTFVTCVRDGRSGHEACLLEHSTAYAWFGADELSLKPSSKNRARAMLPSAPRSPAAPEDPQQGAMWALAHLDKNSVVQAPRWWAGRPPKQISVQLSVAEASRLKGGLAWDPSGNLSADTAARSTVVYGAAWPQWSTDNTREYQPKRVHQNDRYEVWQHGHALAIYAIERGQHAWVFHQANTGGFKLDRWGTIQQARLEGDVLVVMLNDMLRRTPIRIQLP